MNRIKFLSVFKPSSKICTGASLVINTSWKNPSGDWHVGYKLVYELFTENLTSRLKVELDILKYYYSCNLYLIPMAYRFNFLISSPNLIIGRKKERKNGMRKTRRKLQRL